MKKRNLLIPLILLGITMTFSGCGKEEEPVSEPETPKITALDESQPIPEDPGTLELSEQSFASANLILQLPEGVTAEEGEADDLYGYVTVTDDSGEWKLLFQPYIDETNLVSSIDNNWPAEVPSDSEEEETQLEKIDWSRDVAGTLAGYSARVWANNTYGKISKTNIAEMPGVDIIVDYGDIYVGRYYGVYIRLELQNPEEDSNIYDTLNREDVRAILNNFAVIEDKSTEEASANGVTAAFPVKWNVTAENRTIIATYRGPHFTSLVFSVIPSYYDTPEELAAVSGEVITKEYGGRTYAGVLQNNGTEEVPSCSLTLYTVYDAESSLFCQIAVGLDDASEEELTEYLEDETFGEIMSSVQMDSSSYSDTTGAKSEGFKVQYGTLMEYTGTEEQVVVPSEIDGFAVETISRDAFRGNTTIKSVEIPDSVTYIESAAFEQCTSLETVILPDSVTVIEENTFQGCTNLQEMVIPTSVTEIGKRAFYQAGAGSFEALGAVVYGEECFEFCGFTSVVLGDGSDLSAADIFRESTISSVQLPADLTELGSYAFYLCGNISELTVPDTVTTLGEGCFGWMEGLRKLTLPEGITELPANLCGSSGIINLSIPASVTVIRNNAVQAKYVFLYNKDVELEDGAITTESIYLDGARTSEDVPKNMEHQYINDQIYISMTATKAESSALDDYYESLGMRRNSWFGPSEAFCDMDTEDYVSDSNWLVAYNGDKTIVNIPPYTEEGEICWLESDVFAGNTTIEGISMGNINSINANAFSGCTSLKDFWFSMDSFTFFEDEDNSVDENAFAGTPEGMTVHFPAGLSEEEFQKYKEICIAKGMPESTTFETYTIE